MTRVGINHMDFSDQPFRDVTAAPEVRAGKLRTLTLTRRYVVSFFDGCIQDRWDALRKLVSEAGIVFPEVDVRRFGSFRR
jgi:hypothetical protein